MEKETPSLSALAEERIQLEREALEVERGRLAAAKAAVEAEARLARVRRPGLLAVSVTLLTLLAFSGGVVLGFALCENRHDEDRERRLTRALSQLGAYANGTNGVENADGRHSVSVVVIQ